MFSVNEERSEVVQFSTTLGEHYFSFVVAPTVDNGFHTLLAPFQTLVWILLVLTFSLTLVVMLIINYFLQPNGKEKTENIIMFAVGSHLLNGISLSLNALLYLFLDFS